jgi:hypothetical protein
VNYRACARESVCLQRYFKRRSVVSCGGKGYFVGHDVLSEKEGVGLVRIVRIENKWVGPLLACRRIGLYVRTTTYVVDVQMPVFWYRDCELEQNQSEDTEASNRILNVICRGLWRHREILTCFLREEPECPIAGAIDLWVRPEEALPSCRRSVDTYACR